MKNINIDNERITINTTGIAKEEFAVPEALTKAQTYPLDTIIIGRGGGASEDLSAFNDETLEIMQEKKIKYGFKVNEEGIESDLLINRIDCNQLKNMIIKE